MKIPFRRERKEFSVTLRTADNGNDSILIISEATEIFTLFKSTLALSGLCLEVRGFRMKKIDYIGGFDWNGDGNLNETFFDPCHFEVLK